MVIIPSIGFFFYWVSGYYDSNFLWSQFGQVKGHIDEVRVVLAGAIEKPANLNDLGASYLNPQVWGQPHLDQFKVYEYVFEDRGSFHVIYDENDMVWSRAPTGIPK